MQRDPTLPVQARRLDGSADAVSAALGRGPLTLPSPPEGKTERSSAEEPCHGGGEHHVPPTGVGLQVLRRAMAGELLADAEDGGLEVHVAPAEPEDLADAEPGIGEELQQRAVGVAVRARSVARSALSRMRTCSTRQRGFSPGSNCMTGFAPV